MAKAPVKNPAPASGGTPPATNPAKPTPPKGNTVATNKPTPKMESTAPKAKPKYPNFGITVYAKPETLKIPGDKLAEAVKAVEAVFPGLLRFEPPMGMEKAKELLGWETEADYVAKLKAVDANLNEDSVKFGGDYFLTDRLGNKVRLHLNSRNRPWGESVSLAYMQDLLKKHWKFNGETIILGEFARDLSGQHRLIAEVFAEQERTKDENTTAHWGEFWDGPVEMECIVITGISEDSATTRTLDNVKSRSLSDVIFADTEMFGAYKAVDRKTVARMLDYAVRFLWGRAGENKDQWAPKRTHAESLDFVDRHPRLKECIKHIHDADKDGRIAKYLYPGHAAALLYLMGHAGTPKDDIEDYMIKRPTDEKGLKWGQFKKAKMFWTDLANDAPELKNLRLARRPLPNDTDGFSGFVFAESDDGGGSFDERVGMLVRAWEAYKADQPIDILELTYESATDDTTGATIYVQKEFPTIQDSIDVGKTIKAKKTPKTPKEGEGDEASELDALSGDEEGTEGEDTPDAGETPPKPTGKPDIKEAARKEWEQNKKQYGDNHILFHRSTNNSGNHMVYFDDAEQVGKIVGSRVMTHPATGVTQIVFGENELDECASKLKEQGLNMLILSREGGKWNAKPHQTAEESFNDPAEKQADGDIPDESEEVAQEENGNPTEEAPAAVPAPSAKKVIIKRKP